MKGLLFAIILIITQSVTAQNIDMFFDQSDSFFSSFVDDNGKVNYKAVHQNAGLLNSLVRTIKDTDLSNLNQNEKKAFLINAYNLLAISNVNKYYPISSVRKIRGFFKEAVIVSGEETNLDALEKSMNPKEDPRLHMVLVCAANSCPILWNRAYTPNDLEAQLNKAVTVSLSKSHIVDSSNGGLTLSKIFDWYKDDFKNSGGVISFINQYSKNDLPNNQNLNYAAYDWGLNEGSFPVNIKKEDIIKFSAVEAPVPEKKSSTRYVVSSLYGKGSYDLNFFNNYYVETVRDKVTDKLKSRSIFLTNYLQLIYGINSRLNIGIDLKFRSVTSSIREDASLFEALKYNNDGEIFGVDDGKIGYRKIGFTAIGPKIKIQPFLSVPKFSIQSTVFIPLITSESNNTGYIDWTNPTWQTQFFYDHDITSKLSLFTEIDVILENINGSLFKTAEGYGQISTPLTFIMSYFPNSKSTFYLLFNSTPKWNNNVNSEKELSATYDPYSQYGVGYKYYITPKLQMEFIYTRFHSTNVEKKANTFNFGLRYYGLK